MRSLFDSLKFQSNTSEKISRLERYANAHLFVLDEDLNAKNQDLLNKIAMACDAEITDYDLAVFQTFSEQINSITKLSKEVNCMILFDAEQTYL